MADRAEWTDGDPERRPGVLRRLTWWADAMAYDDENDRSAAIGQSPENLRQALIKLMWIGIWMAYMGAPVSDLVDGHHTVPATVCGALGLLAFVAIYLVLVFRHTGRALSRAAVFGALGTCCVLAAVLTLTMGDAWLVLCVYVSVAYGAVLPLRLARWAIPLNTAFMVAVGVLVRGSHGLVSALVIPSLLGGFAMSGVRQMVRTTRALRAARATVAQLAANEERLRLARDLHDLLGHSLSLITLKSELAGRMLPDKPEQAARQVADIERVSRQALVDVREAVSGFRRPTLEAEVAGARTTLAAAGHRRRPEPGRRPPPRPSARPGGGAGLGAARGGRQCGAAQRSAPLRGHARRDGRRAVPDRHRRRPRRRDRPARQRTHRAGRAAPAGRRPPGDRPRGARRVRPPRPGPALPRRPRRSALTGRPIARAAP
ncbi:hypothetical protein SANTM175S_04164 [Streptomyces antimycoticus]